MSIQAAIETITPAFAVAALNKNKRNRQLSKTTVQVYSEAMKRGEWNLNGEAIIFDSNGDLADGQHRLQAVLASKTPIQSLVVRGVQPESFETIDTGKKRNDKDILSINGHKNPHVLAAACRAIIRIERGAFSRAMVTTPMLLSTITAHPDLPSWVTLYVGSPAQKFMVSSYVAVLCLTSEKHGVDKAASFHQLVASGVGLKEGDPAHTLREKFIARAYVAKHKDTALIYCIKAMNAHIKGEPLRMLRSGSDDAFPDLA